MKKAGIIILIIGLAFTLFTGMSFVTEKKVLGLGKLKIMANRSHSLSWSPAVGVILMATGAGFYLAGKKSITS